eukprot:TRINITY_DN20251_c0_g2_i1.p1 TRINITY_DN20251_c0_g2~~TRINITY_DN20251_c0_g2_i1.p1  ORF type:complete len:628 (-),score=96.83 TRINITY_DN20251_c0_g2_i1:29-1912(-)
MNKAVPECAMIFPCATEATSDVKVRHVQGTAASTPTCPRCAQRDPEADIIVKFPSNKEDVLTEREPVAEEILREEMWREKGQSSRPQDKLPLAISRSEPTPALESVLNSMQILFAELSEDNRKAERIVLAHLQTLEYQIQNLASSVETHIVKSAHGLITKSSPEKPLSDGVKEKPPIDVVVSGTVEPKRTTMRDDSMACDKREPPTVCEVESSVAMMEHMIVDETEEAWTPHMLDVIPAMVVLLNAVVIGVSTDVASTSTVWMVMDWGFAIFFIGEILVKWHLYGIRPFFAGAQRLWNIFDCFCVCVAVLDFCIALHGIVSGIEPADISGLMLMKLLRLAKLLRLVRLMRYRIFTELKSIITGLFCGLRVLLWAQALLGIIIYLGGIIMTNMIGAAEPEFSTLPDSMFSLFRCFTDGCSAYDGVPLHERIRHKYGGVVFVGWIVSYVFVTIGLFNLIMAVFIEHVSEAQSVQRKKRICENAISMQKELESVMVDLCMNSCPQVRKELRLLTRGSQTAKSNEDHRRGLQECSNVKITRDTFNTWMCDDVMMKILDEADVDLSSKFEIFDVLDADASGYLTMEELREGIMSLRGPIRKTEIVAIKLATRCVIAKLEEMQQPTEQQQACR